MVETLGFRWAVTMAKEKGGARLKEMHRVLFICFKEPGLPTRSSLVVLIRDITNISSSFSDISFSFVSHEFNNRVAHLVAKYVLSVELPTTWNENFSDRAYREALLDVSFRQRSIK